MIPRLWGDANSIQRGNDQKFSDYEGNVCLVHYETRYKKSESEFFKPRTGHSVESSLQHFEIERFIVKLGGSDVQFIRNFHYQLVNEQIKSEDFRKQKDEGMFFSLQKRDSPSFDLYKLDYCGVKIYIYKLVACFLVFFIGHKFARVGDLNLSCTVVFIRRSPHDNFFIQ